MHFLGLGLQRLFHLDHVQGLSFGALGFRGAQGQLEIVGQLALFGRDDAVAIGPLQGVDLLFQRGDETIDALLVGLVLPDFGVRNERVIFRFRGEEHRLHAVVILLRNGIELVIVAARATYCHAEEGAGRGGEDVVHFVHAGHLGLDVLLRSEAQERGGQQGVLSAFAQLVAGDLFADKAVVRPIAVKRAYDVVTIAPGLRAVAIVFVAAGIGVADQVQPVTGPALAVVRTGQQAIDQAIEGVGRIVLEERFHFGRVRRQAGHVKIGAADERAAAGWRRGF